MADDRGAEFDALVLAGGAGSRMGGVDKPGLVVGGMTLLDRVLLATSDARRTVVVGPRRPTCRPVTWCREDPVGGGPLAPAAAGIGALTRPVTVLLAADLPFLTAACVDKLAAGALAVLSDGDGDGDREQWLCSAWRTDDFQAAGRDGDDVQGGRLGRLLERLNPTRLSWDGDSQPWADCDTIQDALRATEIAGCVPGGGPTQRGSAASARPSNLGC